MANGKRREGPRVVGGTGTGKTRAGFNFPQTQAIVTSNSQNPGHPSNNAVVIGPTFQPATLSPVQRGTSTRDAGQRSL
jgi:phage terminase large subunit-like protein